MMDWSAGRLVVDSLQQRSSTAPGQRWRLTCAADWMPRASHVPAMIADPDAFYGDLLPQLQPAQLRLVNVECVLGDRGEPIPKGGPNLRAPEETIASLTNVPFDVACLANNHCLDYGPAGLAYTIERLRSAGLATVGAGPSEDAAREPFRTVVGGVGVAVINCAEGEASRSVNGGPGANGIDLTVVRGQIDALKAAGDVVVVVFHGGREHLPVPPPYVVRDLRRIADLGADVVIAHHPHVPQGIEIHHGVPIAYSLGNFAFRYPGDQFYHHVGYVLHVDFVGAAVAGINVTPYRIGPDSLHVLAGDERAVFDHGLERATEALASDETIQDAWDAAADHETAPARLRTTLTSAVDAVEADDAHGIATAGNLFFTPAHHELFAHGLRRRAVGAHGSASQSARDLLDHYLTYGTGREAVPR